MALARTHVRTPPTCSSHYSRTISPKRVYLPPGSSVAAVYSTYLEDLKAKRKENLRMSLFMYGKIFYRDFNIDIAPSESNLRIVSIFIFNLG